VPLAKALCKNLPAENAQGELSRPKPTRVVVPTEEEEEEYYMLILRLVNVTNIWHLNFQFDFLKH
jgi:hypothetical protein